MSIELRDFRDRITPESWCWIEAEARVREIDAQQVVREVLHAWSLQQQARATVAARLLASEGLAASDEGGRGK